MADATDVKVTVEEQGEDDANERSPLNSKDGSTKGSHEKLNSKQTYFEVLTDWVQKKLEDPEARRNLILAASALLVIIFLLFVLFIWIFVIRDPLWDRNFRYLSMDRSYPLY